MDLSLIVRPLWRPGWGERQYEDTACRIGMYQSFSIMYRFACAIRAPFFMCMSIVIFVTCLYPSMSHSHSAQRDSFPTSYCMTQAGCPNAFICTHDLYDHFPNSKMTPFHARSYQNPKSFFHDMMQSFILPAHSRLPYTHHNCNMHLDLAGR